MGSLRVMSNFNPYLRVRIGLCKFEFKKRTDLFRPITRLQGSDEEEDEDLKELLNDTRLLKRLKKGKISEEDFNKQMEDVPLSSTQTGSPKATDDA